MKIELTGQIDSENAAQIEQVIHEKLDENEKESLILDASALEYISSAGLRVLLRLRKTYPELRITDVNSDVYEILEMTGFTEMMQVEKAYRVVSIEGCEEIGRGANGTIYRIDKDNVVKVFNNPEALEDIQREREVAKLALILGIPTAISYDVVKVGDSYGSVFELLNARSFSKILAGEPEKIDWCVEEYIKMLKIIHGTVVPAGKLPDMRETALDWAVFMQDYLPEKYGKKLLSLIEAVPHDDHMLHGDYHTKNLELQNDEVLLIDMDTLAVGNPIFEFGSIYNAFVGFSECDHEVIKKFQGFDYVTGRAFWRKALAAYLGTTDETKICEVEDKARIIGYTRMIRRSIRRKGLESADSKAEIDHWTKELIELLDKTDSLLFECVVKINDNKNELDVEASEENLHIVMDYVDKKLESIDCSPKDCMQIGIAVEEIFINIAHYAYAPDKGRATVRVEVSDDPVTVTITFIDNGIPYDPLTSKVPDTTMPAEKRMVGGLGIFLTRNLMDDMSYEYKDGKNILTLKKNLQ